MKKKIYYFVDGSDKLYTPKEFEKLSPATRGNHWKKVSGYFRSRAEAEKEFFAKYFHLEA